MKKVRQNLIKALSVILVVLMITMACPVVSFAEGSNTAPVYVTESRSKALWAEGTNADTKKNIDAIKWYSKNGKYYWFLPSSADLSNLVVYHNFERVTVGNTDIINGNAYNIFENGKEYTVYADGIKYTLCVQKANNMGSMFFTTQSGSMDYVNQTKGNTESGDMVVIDYDGSISYDNALDSIKGRGNSTWRLDKKPYNIKLAKKTALMGMDKNKKWCLLANAQEHSMIRNKLMYDLADEVGLEYSPESRFVDLYANGEYQGTYQVTQKVEAGDGDLVDITDLEAKTEEAVANALGLESVDLGEMYGNKKYSTSLKTAYNIPYNPDDITGGYLMEFVVAMDEPSSFKTRGGQMVNVKAPEYCSVEQINYISSFMQDLENALYSSTGYNSKGKHYTDYLDMRSAVIMYILQEFSVNVDGGITSCFFYKDSDLTGDGKVHASPCWDFDVSLGNLTNVKDNVSMTSPDKWFIKNSYRYSSTRTIFSQLCQHTEFMDEVKKVWNDEFLPAFEILRGEKEGTGRLESMQAYYDLTEPSSIMNYTRWDLTKNLLYDAEGITHLSNYNYLVNFVNKRINFMNTGLLNVDGAKKEAIKSINNLIEQYSKEYSSDVIADMKEKAQTGIDSINNAKTNDEISKLLENTISNIDKCKVDTVYFDNTNTQWSELYLYSWGGSLTPAWPGVKMTYEGNNIYSYKIKGSIQNIIFTNGKNESTGDKQQTNNLIFQGNNSMYITKSQYSSYDRDKEAYMYDGEWGKYSKPTVVYGDLNGDGSVTLADAVLIQRSCLNIVSLSDEQKKCADVNGDSDVTLADAVLIQRFIIGAISKFPVEK